MLLKDKVFITRKGEWMAISGGVVHGPWNSKGAALAGLEVERRRLQKQRDKKTGARAASGGVTFK